MTPKEMKTTCQSGEPATDGIADCGLATPKFFASSRAIVGVADRTDPSTSKSIIPKPGIRPPSPCYGVASDPRLQLLAAAKHDRKAPTRPSLPRSAPLGKNTRIMASARSELSLLARTGHRLLFMGDRGCRLKRDTKINLLSITDAALRAAGIVCCRANSPAAHFKWIVMLRAPHPRRGKTGTNLESLRRRYAQHRFRQIRIELVKNRFTKSGRNAAHHAFNNATNRIAFVANLFDQRNHFFGRHGVRAANDVLLDVFCFDRGTIDFRNDFMNLRDVGDNLEFRIQH